MASETVLTCVDWSGFLAPILLDVVVSTSALGAEVVLFSSLCEGTTASSGCISRDSDTCVLLTEMMSIDSLRRLSLPVLFPSASIDVSPSSTTGTSPVFTPLSRG